jgi:hypothetical protein
MARRRTALDAFLDAYLAMDPAERPFAMAALKGADRAMKSKQAQLPLAEADTAAELGAAAAGEDGAE